MPTTPSEDEVLTLVRPAVELGPLGADDRLGTLNHVTPAKRVAAAGLVREGVSVSCSWDMRTGPQPGATVENQRYMLSTGLGLADEGRRNLLGEGRAGGAQEFIGMVFHGLDVTHLDSLAHIFWDGKMYGGVPASMVSDRQGALMHDVLAVSRRRDDPRRAARHRPAARRRRAGRRRPRAPRGPRGGRAGRRHPRRARRRRADAHRRGRRAASRQARLQRQQAALGVPGRVPAVAPRAGRGDAGVRRRPGPDADGLPHRAHADPHGRHRRHGPVADRQLPARGPRRHVRPGSAGGSSSSRWRRSASRA